MREQASDAVSTRPDSDTLPPSQPYTLAQAYNRRPGDVPARASSPRSPVLEGFPYINASPRTGLPPATRAADTRPGDTLTAAAAGGRDQNRPAFQRQRTGGLFVEASEPSPPGFGPQQQSAGLDTAVRSGHQAASLPSRGLFSSTEEHYPYWDKEIQGNSSTGRIFPAAVMSSEKEEESFDQQEGRVQLTRGQKTKRHCARWWWIYLIVFICIVVLVVCLV